jgi:hypothetical protein
MIASVKTRRAQLQVPHCTQGSNVRHKHGRTAARRFLALVSVDLKALERFHPAALCANPCDLM